MTDEQQLINCIIKYHSNIDGSHPNGIYGTDPDWVEKKIKAMPEMTEIIKAFQEGNVEEFRRLFPETDLDGINVMDLLYLLYTLFDSTKLLQQREMVEIVKGKSNDNKA